MQRLKQQHLHCEEMKKWEESVDEYRVDIAAEVDVKAGKESGMKDSRRDLVGNKDNSEKEFLPIDRPSENRHTARKILVLEQVEEKNSDSPADQVSTTNTALVKLAKLQILVDLGCPE